MHLAEDDLRVAIRCLEDPKKHPPRGDEAIDPYPPGIAAICCLERVINIAAYSQNIDGCSPHARASFCAIVDLKHGLHGTKTTTGRQIVFRNVLVRRNQPAAPPQHPNKLSHGSFCWLRGCYFNASQTRPALGAKIVAKTRTAPSQLTFGCHLIRPSIRLEHSPMSMKRACGCYNALPVR
jgi:hypothetical protein